MALRLALLTPFAFPSVRGNAITVERITRGLRDRGVDVRVWDLSAAAASEVEHAVTDFRPTAIHAFHALRAGPLALRLARRAELPLVVTMTGTDANHDLFAPDTAAAVRRVLEGARAITVFHDSIRTRIARALPDLESRIAVVPQSVWFEDGGDSVSVERSSTDCIFVFPAGIRPVKRPRFPLAPLDRIAARRPGLALLYVGPVLDATEGALLTRELSRRPWARYLGAVPHSRMRGLLLAADVVLNCSVSEGGMANSVLEAMALGRAVLASDIEGNRSLIEDGVTGLLFDTDERFVAQAERLIGDPALRQRLGEAGRARVTARFGIDRELDGYLALYRDAACAVRGS